MYYYLLAIYVLFMVWFYALYKVYGLSLYTSVFVVYTVLIGIPFFIIFSEIEGIFNISEILGRDIDERISLELGNGIKPISFLLLFNLFYLSVGSVYLKKYRSVMAASIIHTQVPHVFTLAKWLLLVFLVYSAARFYVTPDFPLFVAMQNGFDSLVLRDVAFAYGSSRDSLYIFYPSINSQFYRVLLPLVFFIVLFYYSFYKKSNNILVLLILLALITIILNLGTFKRTPIIYIFSWFILYQYMFRGVLDKIKFIKWVVLTVLILVLITVAYEGKNPLLSLLSRLTIGEAVGEFVAIEHYGKTFNYKCFDLYMVYLQKVVGMDVVTFSESWKMNIGGSRGYTSIGAIGEFIISFGFFSVILFPIFSALILEIDLVFKKYSLSVYRPMISGLIVMISFAMVKGLPSQLFTGGIGTLIVVSLITRYAIHKKI